MKREEIAAELVKLVQEKILEAKLDPKDQALIDWLEAPRAGVDSG